MEQNKTSKYFKYAIGEIILVVIGILIALSINNWNEHRKERISEVKYLTNIKLDLQKDIISLNEQINIRKNKDVITNDLILHINGNQITDIDLLAKNVYSTIMEERFTPNNGTYNELASSGNLSLIENDSIKQLLLELVELYKNNSFTIEHEAFEYKEYINKSLFRYVDLDRLKPVYYGEKTAAEQNINFDNFNALLKSLEYKNGLAISNIISKDFIPFYENIKDKSIRIIEIINKNLEANND
jgi:hypothetical protein